jgi:hypothetical protein
MPAYLVISAETLRSHAMRVDATTWEQALAKASARTQNTGRHVAIPAAGLGHGTTSMGPPNVNVEPDAEPLDPAWKAAS